jgi:CheY-like chemotaxis protein
MDNLITSQSALPQLSTAPMNSSEETRTKPIDTNRRVRTLIADDSHFALKALAQILELEGRFTLVGTATDGCQAILRVLDKKPDLVLMDNLMPHLSGIEATRRIKQFENPPLVIIVTSDDSSNCKTLAKAAGADGFVSKGGDLRHQLRLLFQELYGFRQEAFPDPQEPQ